MYRLTQKSTQSTWKVRKHMVVLCRILFATFFHVCKVLTISGANMPTIDVKKCNNNVEIALRRLRRVCERAGINKRIRERLEYHVTKTMKKRRQKAAARKRQQKQLTKDQQWISARPRRHYEQHSNKANETA
jgi:ribosomal protein S21